MKNMIKRVTQHAAFVRVRMAAALAAMVSFAALGTTTVSDGVMTITDAGYLSTVLSAAEKAQLTGNTVTKVIVNLSAKTSALSLDVDLSSYTGGWTIQKGQVNVELATGALGSGSSDDAAIEILATYGQLFVPTDMKATVSNPIRISGTGSRNWEAIKINDAGSTTTTLTLTGKLTISTTCKIFFAGKSQLSCQGGFEHTDGIVDAPGAHANWIIENVPCTAAYLYLNYVTLNLKVAGNEIGVLDLEKAGKVELFVDGALAGCATRVINCAAAGSKLTLNGHSAFLGGIGNWSAGSVISSAAATLTISNDTDVTVGTLFDGKVSLKKMGVGNLTFTHAANTTAGMLEIADGCVEMAATAQWTKITGVTLSGGSLVLGSDYSLGTGQAALTVPDAGATGALKVPDGCVQTMASVSWAGTDRGTGTFGGAASAAGNKLAFFTAADTGVLIVENVLTVRVESGNTSSIGSVVSAEDLALINSGAITRIEKRGSGTLVLDQALDYTGSWLLREGSIQATAPSYAFGRAATDGRPDGITLADSAYATRFILGDENLSSQTTYVEKPINIERVITTGIELLATYGKVHLTRLLTLKSAKVTVYGGNGVGEFHTEGGVKASGSVVGSAAGGHWYWYAPVEVGTLEIPWLKHHFMSPSNRIDNINLAGANTLYLECDDAFPFLPNLLLAYAMSGSTQRPSAIDMQGHDMAVADLKSEGNPSVQTVNNTGARPVTLSFQNSEPYTNANMTLSGPISLVKGGDSAYSVNCAYGAACTGSLTVTNGTFAFLADGTWAGCTNVTVSGASSVLELNASTNLANRTDIVLVSGGKMSLAEGVAQHVGNLWRDGRPGGSGTYGSSASPAKYKDDTYFMGQGVVYVHSSYNGFVVVFK